jgi:hypothetical protein
MTTSMPARRIRNGYTQAILLGQTDCVNRSANPARHFLNHKGTKDTMDTKD